ncbi:hypothetical protein [Chromobacterium sphagni]|uniref:hypothetical protein n=1 Tax=Chromobacterium sphagni TaxID=1903179 RepID=UPI0011140183|nr:hypothetical protein [Chromobacterium sphagni]
MSDNGKQKYINGIYVASRTTPAGIGRLSCQEKYSIASTPSWKIKMNLLQRAAAPIKQTQEHLGPLAELAGAWVSHGYNMIAVPDHQNKQIFRLIVNATKQTPTFTP